MSRLIRLGGALILAVVCIGAAMLYLRHTSVQGAGARERAPFQAGMPLLTGPGDLVPSRHRLQAYLAAHPDDLPSAIRFADLALREVRVTGNGGLAVSAEGALRTALKRATTNTFEAERMLAAVLLAQHRFVEASQVATRLSAMEPSDTWLHGVLGDAALERGRYAEAFDAFDRMAALRPDASSYARVAYALELQGKVTDALRVMEMARAAASPHDLESLAWHASQVGALQYQLGRLGDARQSYERALFTFPAYPPALAGRAEVQASTGDIDGALASLQAAVEQAPAPGWVARLGDLRAARGESDAAARQYALADAAWSADTPEPREHALFLAARGVDVPRALAMARQAARGSEDIFTCDALAWAAFKSGDLETARRQITRALRTGTRHRRLQFHAAAILEAAGDRAAARQHLILALDRHPGFDPIDTPAARLIAARLGVAHDAPVSRLATVSRSR